MMIDKQYENVSCAVKTSDKVGISWVQGSNKAIICKIRIGYGIIDKLKWERNTTVNICYDEEEKYFLIHNNIGSVQKSWKLAKIKNAGFSMTSFTWNSSRYGKIKQNMINYKFEILGDEEEYYLVIYSDEEIT